MIKPNELRIGNYVQWSGEPGVYVPWMHGHWLGTFNKNYPFPEPVPLTSEWLLKFGFKLEDITWYDASVTKNVYCKGQYYVDMRESLGTGYLFGKMDNEYPGYRNILVRPVQYVDQIQNVFYFITGEELTIEE